MSVVISSDQLEVLLPQGCRQGSLLRVPPDLRVGNLSALLPIS